MWVSHITMVNSAQIKATGVNLPVSEPITMAPRYALSNSLDPEPGRCGDTVISLPPSIGRLRRRLLDFDRSIPKVENCPNILTEEHKSFPDTSEPPPEAIWSFKDGDWTKEESKTVDRQVESFKAAQSIARHIQELNLESEAKWTDEFLEHIFKEFREVYPDHYMRRHK